MESTVTAARPGIATSSPGVPDAGQTEKGALLLCLPAMPSDALHTTLDTLAHTFRGRRVLIASPDYESEDSPVADGSVRIIPYTTPRADLDWVLGARDYVTAAQLTAERGATGVMLLGADATSLSAEALLQGAERLHAGADLVLPRYQFGPHEGLVTSALLYPMTRALFGIDVRFPLALDAGMSPRMAQRLAAIGQRQTNLGQANGLLWGVAEAATAGFQVAEFAAGKRTLPQPSASDFNSLFTSVAGSLFADVESRAVFWQRARNATSISTLPRDTSTSAPEENAAEVNDLVQGYKLAFRNLQEVWSLVLPPQSLLALKKLSLATADEFHFPANLWARVSYDFTLAFHARNLNRGHLLGSFTPLYLAWVASALRAVPTMGDRLIEETATAFEREKTYLVSRWRWPDRFNP